MKYNKAYGKTLMDIAIYGNTIIALFEDGTILKSPDLGLTWKTVSTWFTNQSNNIIYDYTNNMFVASGGNTVIYSTDLGKTWNKVNYAFSEIYHMTK